MNRRFIFLLVGVMCAFNGNVEAQFKVGVGRADCTGPAAEITFMGYAKLDQKGCGIHLRQFSRAYVIQDHEKLACFVTVDACMMNIGIKQAVLAKLEKNHKGLFTQENLILSGTHTHSTPGGFMMNVLYDFPSLGFTKETFNPLVSGIFKSIERAYKNLRQADIYFNEIHVDKLTNINRSPQSYLENSKEERDKYKDGDTDKVMTQLKFCDAKGCFGAINWFPVHPTSMNNTNCLITSDNVGYASILLEQANDQQSLPGQSQFVGAFASTNLGDVSPNTQGPKCINTGEPCDSVHSSCNGGNKYCIASGPGKDIFESTKIIAENLFAKANEMLQMKSSNKIQGKVQYIHQFVSMPDQTVQVFINGQKQNKTGCRPGMGYAFAAGTTDGPGEFDFQQATNTTNPFWNMVRDFIFPPSPEDVACHHPKPILIMSGNIKLPYEWQPEVVATQILKIGNIVLAAVPGEFTTMSGRRLKDAIKSTIKTKTNEDVEVIVAGLSNTYTSYIATREEYGLQRYEGASTIYGPYTLEIYLKQYKMLAEKLITGTLIETGPEPYKFPANLLSLITPVIFDTSGWLNEFGDCIQQPPKTVFVGQVVVVKFISGHPRNNVKQGHTFLKVEKKTDNPSNTWVTIANDASWETRFKWRRTDIVKGSSEVEISWDTNKAKPGTYRISHFGDYKYIFGGIYPYQGQTREFAVQMKN